MLTHVLPHVFLLQYLSIYVEVAHSSTLDVCFNYVLQIFKTLQDNYKDETYTCRSTINVSSELPQPPPPHTPAWTDTSVDDLRSQFTKLGPQEDTYCCTQHVHMPSLNSKVSSSSSVDQSKETLGMVFSQRFPCESDESQGFSQYISSSNSSSVSKKNIPETARSQGDGDYSSSGSQVDLSTMSSAAGRPTGCYFSLIYIKTTLY